MTLFKEGKVLALRCETLLKNAQSAIESAAKGEPAVPAGAPATLFSHDA